MWTTGDLDTEWASTGLTRERALSEWNRVISAEISGTRISVDCGAPFAVAWRRFGLGPIDLHFYDCQPLRVERCSRAGLAGHVVLVHARRGPIQIRHYREDFLLAPGSLILLDDSSRYSMGFPQGGECLTARMPEQWLRRWVAQPQALLGRPIGADVRWSRPLAEMLAAVSTAGVPSQSATRAMLADHIGVLTAMIADHPDGAAKGRRNLFDRIVDIVRDRYYDLHLSPRVVSDEVGISRGHLHRVMAMGGPSFCTVLMETRIARASEMLLDKRHADTPVGEIAWLCGFADSGHFARAFRASLGVSPSLFRSRLRL